MWTGARDFGRMARVMDTNPPDGAAPDAGTQAAAAKLKGVRRGGGSAARKYFALTYGPMPRWKALLMELVTLLFAGTPGALGLFLLGLKSVGWQMVEVGSFQELEQSGVTQTPHALNMLWLIYMLIPAIGGLLAYIVWLFYDLKDKDVQVMIDCNTGKITAEEAAKRLSKPYQ